MFKLLIGAAIGFAAAWFMDSKEGEQRRALVKDKATTVAGKGKEQAAGVAGQVKDKVSSDEPGGNGEGSYEAATAGEPIAEAGSPGSPGPQAFRQS
jgi:gas vesicle protein